MADREATLRDVEVAAQRLMHGMAECDRLDCAAGDPIPPRLKISEWVSERMRDAAALAAIDTIQGRE